MKDLFNSNQFQALVNESYQQGKSDAAQYGLNQVSLNKNLINQALEEILLNDANEEQEFLVTHPSLSQYCGASILTGQGRIAVTASTFQNPDGCGLVDKAGNAVTNFDITDFQVIAEHSDKTNQICTFNIALDNGELYKMKMSFSEFRNANWGNMLQGMQCQNPKSLKEYIDKLCSDQHLSKITQYDTAGWYINEDTHRLVYVGSDAKSTDDLGTIQVRDDGPCVLQSKTLSETSVAQVIWDSRLLTKSMTSLLLLIYSFLANLYSVFAKTKVGVPKFLVVLEGTASIGKTSLAMSLVNLYRRSSQTEPLLSLRSTKASIDEALIKFKDSVMIIDDLYPAESRAQRQKLEEVLEHVTRMFGDGTVSKRSELYLKRSNIEPQGLALITGEYFCGGLSSQTRCCVLKMQEGDLDWSLLSRYQTDYKMYLPYFLWNYNVYVTDHQDEILEKINSKIEQHRMDYAPLYKKRRTANTHAYLTTAMELFSDYLADCGVIQENERIGLINSFSVFLTNLLLENELAQQNRDPVVQFCNVFLILFEEHPEKFSSLKMEEINKSNYYLEGDFIYTHPQSLLQDYNNVMDGLKIPTAIDSMQTLKNILKDHQILVSSKEGQTTRYSVRIPSSNKLGDRRRFYKLNLKRIYELKEGSVIS